MIPNLKDVDWEQYLKKVDWEQLEKKHSIVIEGHRATVAARRCLLSDKPLFTAVAFLGTKAVDVEINSKNGVPGPIFEVDAHETLTESNVASELEIACMIILGEWEAAQKFVSAE
jgi:hypothetical protein